jgi:fumarate reductase flavoprotein subunit
MAFKSTKRNTVKARLVVVGGGGAGLSAALTAAEMGASGIIVVEKRRSPGGNTALAGGLFACESPVQAREKIIADRNFLFKKAMDWAHWSRIEPAILRAFLEKSGDTIRWLEEKGLEFNLIRLYPDQQPPVQHNPRGNGAHLIKVLARNCRDRRVQILLQSSCKKIIRGKDGNIASVLILKGDEEIEIKTGCVIIATGGFSGNHELLKKYFPSYYDGLALSGLPLKGDGLFLAAEAGAAIEEYATMLKEGPRFDLHKWPLMIFERDPSTLWVNKDGKRFIDETTGSHVFESVNAMLRQPDKVSYALFDATIRKTFQEKMPGLENALQVEEGKGRVKIASSWDDMARWIGAEPKVLKETITRYNVFCRQGHDADFAKEQKYLKPLETPPYHAIKGLAVMLDTIGGIRINERMEVLDKQNNPIPGLYAAGVTTSGWESEIYCSALSASAFGFAINSGRIAGENAVRFTADIK